MKGYNLDDKGGLFGLFSSKSPSKFVSCGDIVELRHYSIFTPIKVSVIEADDESVRIKSDIDIQEVNIFPSDHVVLEYRDGERIFIFSGIVEMVASIKPLELSIRVEKIENMKDLRKHERFYVSLPSEMKAIGISDPVFVIVKNISFGGVRINCKVDIMMEDIVSLTTKLDDKTKFIFKGRVVRKNKTGEYYEYGIEITEISEENSKKLHQFIYQF